MSFTPGGILDVGFYLQSSTTINEVSFLFSLDNMPRDDERYYWAFEFFLDDAQGGNGQVGYFGFQNNGNIISANDVGGVINFALWDATSGVAGPTGEAGPFGGEGVGYRTPTPYTFQEGRQYKFTLQKTSDVVSLYVKDMTSGSTLLIGSIDCFPDRHIASYFIPFSEVYTDVDSAISMSRVNATWSNFSINGSSTSIVTPVGVWQDPRVAEYNVNWAYAVSANSLSLMSGGTSNSIVLGTSGADEIHVANISADVRAMGGSDTVFGGTANDIISGGSGGDIINGGSGHDTVMGDGGADTLRGGAGGDDLIGGAENDKIYGDAGSDLIVGGSGADQLFGGSDTVRDTFDFNLVSESTSSVRDRISNFKSGIDRIDLAGIDARSGTATNDAFAAFKGTTATAYSVWYVKADVDSDGVRDDILLRADVNGNTTADFEVGILNVASLAAGDVVL